MQYQLVPSGKIRKYDVVAHEKNGDNLEVVLKPLPQEDDTERT